MSPLLASGLVLDVGNVVYATDDHSSHDGGHSSGGKGKGPRYKVGKADEGGTSHDSGTEHSH